MSQPTYLRAEFMGNMEHYPFSNNSVYPIIVTQGWRTKIHVQPCRGFDWDPLYEYKHTFKDLLDFFRVWKVVGVEMGGLNGFYRVEQPDEII